MSGYSSRQGTHQVAQKLRRTTFPFSASIRAASPFASSSPARREGGVCAPAAPARRSQAAAAAPYRLNRKSKIQNLRLSDSLDRAPERLRLGPGDRLAGDHRVE